MNAMASVEALLQDVADSMTESPPDTLKEVLRRQEKARALLVEAVTSQQVRDPTHVSAPSARLRAFC